MKNSRKTSFRAKHLGLYSVKVDDEKLPPVDDEKLPFLTKTSCFGDRESDCRTVHNQLFQLSYA